MGMADRDYGRGHRGNHPSGGRLTPVVRWLLTANIAVFFADVLVLDHILARFGAFSVDEALLGGRIWQLLTFQFLHGGIGHLALNCVGLFFFGPWLERWWGARRFLVYYLSCGAAGALCYALLWWFRVFDYPVGQPLVGASAGLYGILVGVAMLAPNLRVMLVFPPVELSMRQLALGMLGLALVSVFTGFGGNAGGEAGHLGGALLGMLFMRVPGLLGREDAARFDAGPFREPKLRPRPEIPLSVSVEVDRILDKISGQGFQSLTPEERATLEKAALFHRHE